MNAAISIDELKALVASAHAGIQAQQILVAKMAAMLAPENLTENVEAAGGQEEKS